MKVTLVIDGERREVEVDLARGVARLDGIDRPARVLSTTATTVELEIAGERVKVEGWTVDDRTPSGPVVVDGERHRVGVEATGPAEPVPIATAPAARSRSAGPSAGSDAILPPMPGKVIEVRVREGERVSKGAVLLVLEAMKMRNEVVAPKDGIVRDLRVAAGDPVKSGEPMLSVVDGTPGP